MADTASGYILEIPYVAQFHREHAPVWLDAVLAALGRPALRRDGAHWCELGCGPGVGLAILAAANPAVTFHGVDINPGHIEAARALAEAAGLENVKFHCADLGEISDLPDFDCIIARGIYSWVAPEIRQAIRRFAGQRLRPDGVFLLHYLALPGAADFTAIHGLFRALHSQGLSVQEAIRTGQDILKKLHAGKAGFFAAHPIAEFRAEEIVGYDVDYAAHDYLNAYYVPHNVAEVIGDMGQEKLDFVGSATPENNLDNFSVPGNLRELFAAQKTLAMRETVRDMASNQVSRIDLYMRPAPPLVAQEHLAALRTLRFGGLPNLPAKGGVTFSTRIGPVEGPAEIFSPIIESFERQRVISYGDIEALPAFAANPAIVNQALHAMMGAGAIQSVPETAPDREPARRLNAVLLERHKAGAAVPALAAPGLGTGLPLTSKDLDTLSSGGDVSPALKILLA